MDKETQELILTYLDAFNNFYTIISMKRAWRIIKQQNPELDVSDAEFCRFISEIDLDDQYYTIDYDDELYKQGLMITAEPMKQYLIADYLSEFTDDVDEMKATQEGIRFYVPSKDELLRYADMYYMEQNQSFMNMRDFLIHDVHMREDEADDTVLDWCALFHVGTTDYEHVDTMDAPLKDIRRATHNTFQTFRDAKQFKRFHQLYADLYNNQRLPKYRGHTPIEVNRPFPLSY